MPLQSSGEIKMSQIKAALNASANNLRNYSAAAKLATGDVKFDTPDKMSDFWGYAGGSTPTTTTTTTTTTTSTTTTSTTTTSTTTTKAPVWLQLVACDDGSRNYSNQKLDGDFVIDQVVVYGNTRYFTVFRILYTNPGGTQWDVVDAGITYCPTTTTTTTTTTTIPPITATVTAGCVGGSGTGTISITNIGGGGGTPYNVGYSVQSGPPSAYATTTIPNNGTSYTFYSVPNGSYNVYIYNETTTIGKQYGVYVNCVDETTTTTSTTTSTTTTTTSSPSPYQYFIVDVYNCQFCENLESTIARFPSEQSIFVGQFYHTTSGPDGNIYKVTGTTNDSNYVYDLTNSWGSWSNCGSGCGA